MVAKPTIVIAHGIWHSPPAYTPLVSALQLKGYEVSVPFFPSCTGTRPPVASLPEDTQLFRRFVEILVDQGKTVVVVMHSYGGAVACNALEGLDVKSRKRGGVAHLIGLAAHVHPKDYSILDLVHDMGHDELIPLAFDVTEDGSCAQMSHRDALCNNMSDDQAEDLLKTLSRANWQNLAHKLQFEAWKHIPMTYVLTTEDATMPADYQRFMLEKIERAGHKAEVIEMTTGHSMYITKTAEVVQIIDDVARGMA